ncbi:unnamed protein product [Merluccius merluccius]
MCLPAPEAQPVRLTRVLQVRVGSGGVFPPAAGRQPSAAPLALVKLFRREQPSAALPGKAGLAEEHRCLDGCQAVSETRVKSPVHVTMVTPADGDTASLAAYPGDLDGLPGASSTLSLPMSQGKPSLRRIKGRIHRSKSLDSMDLLDSVSPHPLCPKTHKPAPWLPSLHCWDL